MRSCLRVWSGVCVLVAVLTSVSAHVFKLKRCGVVAAACAAASAADAPGSNIMDRKEHMALSWVCVCLMAHDGLCQAESRAVHKLYSIRGLWKRA